MEKIKEGDIVNLKSDNKRSFTVGSLLSISGIEHARVWWFDSLTNEIKMQNVPVAALVNY